MVQIGKAQVVPVFESSKVQRSKLWKEIKESYDELRDDTKKFSAYKKARDKAYGLSLQTD